MVMIAAHTFSREPIPDGDQLHRWFSAPARPEAQSGRMRDGYVTKIATRKQSSWCSINNYEVSAPPEEFLF